MNEIHIGGQIVYPLEMKRGKNGQFLPLTIDVADGKKTFRMKAVCFHENTAHEVAANFKEGDAIQLHGRFRVNNWKKGDEWQSEPQVVFSSYGLPDAATAKPKPDVGEPEMDDDIPF